MQDKPEKTSLDDVARLVRRLKDVPPPGEQRADPDTFSAAFLTNMADAAPDIHALEINLYGALVNREPGGRGSLTISGRPLKRRTPRHYQRRKLGNANARA